MQTIVNADLEKINIRYYVGSQQRKRFVDEKDLLTKKLLLCQNEILNCSINNLLDKLIFLIPPFDLLKKETQNPTDFSTL